jgi:transcriptional regulator with XRE-family HTH domain
MSNAMGRPAFDRDTGERAGAVIRERRTALGLTGVELARRAAFDVSQMRKIEIGSCGTDLAGWRRIATALEMPPADFFARVFTPPDLVRSGHHRKPPRTGRPADARRVTRSVGARSPLKHKGRA